MDSCVRSGGDGSLVSGAVGLQFVVSGLTALVSCARLNGTLVSFVRCSGAAVSCVIET